MEELDKSKSGNPMEGEARGKMSIEEFLAKDEQKDLLRFLTAGWNATASVWEMPVNTSTMPCCSTD